MTRMREEEESSDLLTSSIYMLFRQHQRRANC